MLQAALFLGSYHTVIFYLTFLIFVFCFMLDQDPNPGPEPERIPVPLQQKVGVPVPQHWAITNIYSKNPKNCTERNGASCI